MARHIGYPGGLPYSCLRGVMIMEGGHNLSLQIFRNNPNCKFAIGKFQAATRCSLLQQPSLSPAAAPHLPQLPKSQVQEAGRPWTPCCPLVLCSNLVTITHLCPPTTAHRGARLSVVLHSAAD